MRNIFLANNPLVSYYRQMGVTQTKEPELEGQPFHTGDRIRKARELTGQDRQTFAETIGISRDSLAKYEDTGKAKRSALITVAWATPVRLEWLESGELPWLKVGLDGIEPPTPTVKDGRLIHFPTTLSA